MNNYYNEHNISSVEGTGDNTLRQELKTITYPFDRFNIEVKVTEANEFIGISSVEVNKDFMSYKDKTSLKGFHDVEKFYQE